LKNDLGSIGGWYPKVNHTDPDYILACSVVKAAQTQPKVWPIFLKEFHLMLKNWITLSQEFLFFFHTI